MDDELSGDLHDDEIDEDVQEIMKNHNLEESDAEAVRDLMDELGLDEGDAFDVWEAL